MQSTASSLTDTLNVKMCRGTRFDEWSDKPLSATAARRHNRKLYPDVKSRYLIPKPWNGIEKFVYVSQYVEWMRRWILAHRSRLMPFAELAYVKLLEADGRLDGAAAALSYLLTKTRRLVKRQLFAVVRALSTDDGSPLALTRAAFVLIHDRSRPFDENVRYRAADLLLRMAMSLAAGSDPDEAMCLFAYGWFCARRFRMKKAIQFLDRARRTAYADSDDDRRRLPADIHHVTKSLDSILARDDKVVVDGDGEYVWTAVCFIEHEVLIRMARHLNKDMAERVMLAACRLIEGCGPRYDGHRAVALYKLAVMYANAGEPDAARRRFFECMDVAASAGDGELELDARLEAACVGPEPVDVFVLEWIVERALNRGYGLVLAKAIAVQGHSAVIGGRMDEAYSLFTQSHRLAILVPGASVAINHRDRLLAAICRTYTYLQSSFSHLSGFGFDLRVEELQWTAIPSPFVLRDSDGMPYLHTETYQDVVMMTRVLEMLRRLSEPVDHDAEVDETTATAAASAAAAVIARDRAAVAAAAAAEAAAIKALQPVVVVVKEKKKVRFRGL